MHFEWPIFSLEIFKSTQRFSGMYLRWGKNLWPEILSSTPCSHVTTSGLSEARRLSLAWQHRHMLFIHGCRSLFSAGELSTYAFQILDPKKEVTLHPRRSSIKWEEHAWIYMYENRVSLLFLAGNKQHFQLDSAFTICSAEYARDRADSQPFFFLIFKRRQGIPFNNIYFFRLFSWSGTNELNSVNPFFVPKAVRLISSPAQLARWLKCVPKCYDGIKQSEEEKKKFNLITRLHLLLIFFRARENLISIGFFNCSHQPDRYLCFSER